MVFIGYHQVSELVFKMILLEIEQVVKTVGITAAVFSKHLERMTKHFEVLCNALSVMSEGMDKQQFLNFRKALTPASGFQSAQFRKIEFASTSLINLSDPRYKANNSETLTIHEAYQNLYWRAAGKNHQTGNDLPVLSLFEKKYKKEFLDFINKYTNNNLSSTYQKLSEELQRNEQLIKAMRAYDYIVNVTWSMTHYNVAGSFLENNEDEVDATGGTDWKKIPTP